MNNLIVSKEEAIDRLLNGQIGIILTDTVYGIVTCAMNSSATSRLYKLKDRHNKPGTLIASSTDQLLDIGFSDSDLLKVKYLWPSSLSVILKLNCKSYLHQGIGDIATRIVPNGNIRRLLEKTGPLITSSANLPGQKEATNITEAYNYFGNKVDFYVDSGIKATTSPSTIVKMDDDGNIKVVRQGAVKI